MLSYVILNHNILNIPKSCLVHTIVDNYLSRINYNIITFTIDLGSYKSLL